MLLYSKIVILSEEGTRLRVPLRSRKTCCLLAGLAAEIDVLNQFGRKQVPPLRETIRKRMVLRPLGMTGLAYPTAAIAFGSRDFPAPDVVTFQFAIERGPADPQHLARP